jgi:predicted enzyme related to lactoylglutathione lyase
MAVIESHQSGLPIWIDVMVKTSDQQSQLMSFYSELFGWIWDFGGEDTGFYSIAHHDGRPVFGLGRNSTGEGRMVTYFSTKDMQESLALVERLGGAVFFGPLKVMERGWTALVTDTVGAVHGLWQPISFEGMGVAYEPGAPGWFDHVSGDPVRAAAYYRDLTGHAVLEPEPGMRILHTPEQWFASVSYDQIAGRAPQWSPIFVVQSLARCREAVRSLGGTVILEEMPVPGSFISVFLEPVMNTGVTVMAAGSESA